ncbi:phage antirepressor KilAC domain-containing protein [uncultured Bacteroides sp.]|uniref:phage antirepressor KilAC domain-containing protein n=1 Tax=uncultured Bacteroides sp. TaxID=162156 RepID=UPI002AA6CAFF|nr:phage antirepressor KilAC domain-containing protein [uncultured Bacteroides sp.]
MVQIFKNAQFGEIRTAELNGEPIFCLADVCSILGLTSKGVAQRLSDGAISNYPIIDALGREQMANFVNEDGLYDAILDSRKPEAKQFRKWVTSEILPSVRKHGAYLTKETINKALTDPDTIIQLAMQLKEERAEKERLSMQNDLQSNQLKLSAPKVQYFDTVLQSKSTHTTNQIAKELGMSAVTLNRKLKDLNIQYWQSGQWLLAHRYQNKGYTQSRTYQYTDSCGAIKTNMLTVWTEAGRLAIHKWMEL